MDSFSLANIPTQNIIKILKKCNDGSFVNFIRTCRKFYEIAEKMEKKSRIFCHAYLPAFVYFDYEENGPMIDVPLDILARIKAYNEVCKREKERIDKQLEQNNEWKNIEDDAVLRIYTEKNAEKDQLTDELNWKLLTKAEFNVELKKLHEKYRCKEKAERRKIDEDCYLDNTIYKENETQKKEDFKALGHLLCPCEDEEKRLSFSGGALRCETRECEISSENIFNAELSVSHLLLMSSERSRAYYTKMEIDDFSKLIEYFSFNKTTIEGCDYDDYRGSNESIDINSRSYLVAEGIARILPYIRSVTVKCDYLEKADMHLGALRPDSCKELVASDWTAIQKYNFVWNRLESVVFEPTYNEEDATKILKEMITRWKSRQTSLKHLHLQHYTLDTFHMESIDNLRPFMDLPYRSNSMEVGYMMVEDNGRFRYAIISSPDMCTYCFYDISDCDGCQCQTEFCFKKLIEAITDEFKASEGIDWSLTMEQWNFGSMEYLGKHLEKKLICRNRDTCRCRTNCYGPDPTPDEEY